MERFVRQQRLSASWILDRWGLGAGVGLLAAPVTALKRDMEHAFGLLPWALFAITPVFVPAATGSLFGRIAAANPLVTAPIGGDHAHAGAVHALGAPAAIGDVPGPAQQLHCFRALVLDLQGLLGTKQQSQRPKDQADAVLLREAIARLAPPADSAS